MADLATASSTAYLVATHRGRLVRAVTIIANAITTRQRNRDSEGQRHHSGDHYRDAIGLCCWRLDSVELAAIGTATYVTKAT